MGNLTFEQAFPIARHLAHQKAIVSVRRFGFLIHECLELWHGLHDLAQVLDLIDQLCAGRAQDEGQKRDWHNAIAMMTGYRLSLSPHLDG